MRNRKKVVKKVPLTEGQREVLKILKEEFSARTAKNKKFSLRQFSSRLGVPVPIMSEIFNEKRNISSNLAAKMFTALNVDASRAQLILNQLVNEKAKKKSQVDLNQDPQRIYSILEANKFEALSNWWYFAILSLGDTKDCPAVPEAISKRLGITESQVKQALDVCYKNDLLRNENGILKSTGKSLQSNNDIADAALRKHHLQGLELAKVALEKIDVLKREFGAITMAINPSKIPEAKILIRNFRKQMCEFLEQDEKTEIYRLQVQLFPVGEALK